MKWKIYKSLPFVFFLVYLMSLILFGYQLLAYGHDFSIHKITLQAMLLTLFCYFLDYPKSMLYRLTTIIPDERDAFLALKAAAITLRILHISCFIITILSIAVFYFFNHSFLLLILIIASIGINAFIYLIEFITRLYFVLLK